ncbi:hypothetical protein [Microlunatus sp. GCM10028923]|uniref:hypothetical protein n=1 Tax=Microlunatus sp. GCM10028923 TaxID=3273400 RepID=UPI00361FDCE2
MATWEDGPEYAPIQRPNQFTVPEVPPLSMAPPVAHPAAGAPAERPRFDVPSAPTVALEALRPEEQDPRDPSVPFEVVSSAATTADSAWGAAHWSRPDGDWGPPAGAPEALPYDPTTPMAQHAPPPTSGHGAVDGGPTAWAAPNPYGGPAQSGYPAPGTTEWFAPPPSAGPPANPADAGSVLKAATPGVLITLGIGGFIYLVAPLTLGIAFALANRITVAKEAVRRVFLVGLGVLAFFALVGALTNGDSFVDWWSFVGWWAVLISWCVGIALLIVIYRALRNPGPGGGYQRPWS